MIRVVLDNAQSGGPKLNLEEDGAVLGQVYLGVGSAFSFEDIERRIPGDYMILICSCRPVSG